MGGFSYRGAVLAVAVGNIGVLSALYVTQPVLPQFAADFGVSAAVAGLTVSLATLGLAFALLLAGPISDRVGRRKVMITASLALAVPTVGVALSPTFSLVLLFRIAQGICSAGVGSISLAYIIQEFPGERAGSGLGWGTLSLVGAAIVGRVGGGIVADAWGWRVMFLVFALVDLAGVAIMARFLPAERKFHPSAGIGQSFRGLVTHTTKASLLRIDAVGFLLSFTLLAYFAQLSFYLVGRPFELSTGQIGLVYLVYLVGALAPLAGGLSTRLGRKWVIAVGLVLLVAGCVGSMAQNLPAVVLATAIASLGLFVSHTASNAFVGDVTQAHRGGATALYMFSYYVGGSIGVFVLGVAWQTWGWHGVIAGCAAAALVGLGIALTLPFTTGSEQLGEPEAAL